MCVCVCVCVYALFSSILIAALCLHVYQAVSDVKVVLLHGWLQSHTCWIDTAMHLCKNYGYSILLIDFVGHGKSLRKYIVKYFI